jgi:hypothetical protein
MQTNLELPESIKTWISDFCSGKVSVLVGHRMRAVNENLTNICLQEALHLIRTNENIQSFINGNAEHQIQVANYTATCIHDIVLSTFATAQYIGD